jgi:sortase (surface protein transpeptidase)
MSLALKNIIVLIILVVLAFFGYKYFMNSKTSTTSSAQTTSSNLNANSPANSSSLSSSNSNTSDTNNLDNADAMDQGTLANDEYIKELSIVDTINFNPALFTDDAYKILKVSNLQIPDEPKGRVNPFAPTGQDGFVASTTVGTYPTLPVVPAPKKTTTKTTVKVPPPAN